MVNNKFKRVATTSERLKEAMRIRKMKQVDIVRNTGIDRGSVSHYVSGRYEPKNEAVFKMAKTLDVSETWLWGYDVPMERKKNVKEKGNESDVLCARVMNDPDLMDAIRKYYKLNEVGKSMVLAYIQGQYDKLHEDTVEEMLEKCVAPDDVASNQ